MTDTAPTQSAPSPRATGVMVPRDLPADRVLSFVVEAERLGFDEAWTVEDLGFRGGIAQTAAALAVTSRIRIGVGILPAAARQVAFAAMEVATLAELFPGRVDVGVGHGSKGWMQQLDIWPASPLTLLQEWLQATRALLHGERLRLSGRYVTLDHVALEMVPAVVPPLLAGVRGPKSLRLAGRYADGTVLAEPAGPEYVAEALGHIAADGPHRVVAYNVARVEDDPDRAVELARPAMAPFALPDWDPHLTSLPFAEELTRLRQDATDPGDFVDRLPAEWIRQLSIAGTPEEARQRIAAIHDAGAASVVLIPAGPDDLPSLARALN
ncbi:LLM class flavin-dependent oxidoreductase [Auraticoccus monumenti]|uniref:Flavin-dependent oxidoreductase, luciferase family (Includes alkanesulfonate monooxygenase SsuD and methylene tetrahydromethanopterin reductase) n=1 Tax=Auraticoccus monumenti TaxID=675864 RepID=A0A1G6Z0Q1_9ACTN|nr:LLM class flavin-dependent oxidoreductase [Auraticoccus monumenti]SDD95487.1 Flavin-dependent oxidoreductase, luciferase family (includes alkanesulfonate monooxygenase SsuD and methylene tetrahydromethanopterin reductase) [Auraticoccus monumenti]